MTIFELKIYFSRVYIFSIFNNIQSLLLKKSILFLNYLNPYGTTPLCILYKFYQQNTWHGAQAIRN